MPVLLHSVAQGLPSRIVAVKISNSQRPSSSNHSTRHWPVTARSSNTFAGSAPGWAVFVIMVWAQKKYPCVATLAGLLLRLAPVDWAPRMKVEARTPVERALSMPIERRGADAALRFGFGAPRRVFEGAHILLTPSTLLPHQSQSGVTDLYGRPRNCRSTAPRT